MQVVKRVGAAATVTFLTALFGLAFAVFTAFKPDEPPAKGADIAIRTFDRVSFGQYLDRIEGHRSEYPRAVLERAGALVGVEITVQGYRGQRLPLRWRIVDTRSGDQVQRSQEDRYFLPYTTKKDQNHWPIWVPLPRGRDRLFFVEFELFDDGGTTPLQSARTALFKGCLTRRVC